MPCSNRIRKSASNKKWPCLNCSENSEAVRDSALYMDYFRAMLPGHVLGLKDKRGKEE